MDILRFQRQKGERQAFLPVKLVSEAAQDRQECLSLLEMSNLQRPLYREAGLPEASSPIDPCPAQLRTMQVLKTPPDLVVEVLSPSNTRDGMLEDYRKVGVRECWSVSPEAETVEVLQISADGITTLNIRGTDGTVNSEILKDFTPALKEFFS